jgi:hypothetical protein
MLPVLAISESKPGETPVARQFSGTSYSANGMVQERPTGTAKVNNA